MTATILLIRHARHHHVGHTLTGRMENVGLSAEGMAEAAALAEMLADVPLEAVHSSPALRTRQTAEAVAAQRVPVTLADPLNEVDFGEWTGRTFADLDSDHQWKVWNTSRAGASAPGGESMVAAQQRAWDYVANVAERFAGATIALVSHCDIIRAIIARVLGMSLDGILRFDVDPASVSRIVVGAWGERVLSINGRAA